MVQLSLYSQTNWFHFIANQVSPQANHYQHLPIKVCHPNSHPLLLLHLLQLLIHLLSHHHQFQLQFTNFNLPNKICHPNGHPLLRSFSSHSSSGISTSFNYETAILFSRSSSSISRGIATSFNYETSSICPSKFDNQMAILSSRSFSTANIKSCHHYLYYNIIIVSAII